MAKAQRLPWAVESVKMCFNNVIFEIDVNNLTSAIENPQLWLALEAVTSDLSWLRLGFDRIKILFSQRLFNYVADD